MTVGQNVHKATWRRGVATFLALTPFMRQQLIAAGIPERIIVVRSSWVPDIAAHRTKPGSSVLFLGRLEESKGVLLLLDAWRRTQRHQAGRKLVIAGDGPLAPVVAALAEADSSIHFLGRISSERAIGLLDDSAYVVIPSIWFEGYPLVMAEARSRGRATLAFEGGSPASVLKAGGGWAIPPSGDSLLRALDEISAPAAVDEGDKARRLYEHENSPEVALASLLDVYERVRPATGLGFGDTERK
jgi:glycosyltransferase involved in cell wall biosynthesis